MPFDGKAMLKGGWHPAGDKQIKRETWKSDIKGLATGKKKDPLAEQRANHQSTPLQSLKDPDSFGPPPKARSHYGEDGRPINPVAVPGRSSGSGVSAANIPHSLASIPTEHKGGLGAPVVETGYAQRRQREAEERERREQEELNRERGPYQKDTTGINTANFAPPPRHYAVGGGSGTASPVQTAGRASPALPPRVPPRQATLPPPPSRQTTGTTSAAPPPPFLPPRQNEYPDEHTPAPPPSYGEALNAPSTPAQNTANKFESAATGAATRFGQQAATSWMNQQRQQQSSNQEPGTINQGAASRLAGAGVSVPGFGIGGGSSSSGQHQQQVPMPSSQQVQSAATFASGAASRFGQQPQQNQATGGQGHGSQLSELQQRFARMGTGSNAAPAGQESGVIAAKKPPPPPPKKAGLQAAPTAGEGSGSAPPPVPMSSKPKW